MRADKKTIKGKNDNLSGKHDSSLLKRIMQTAEEVLPETK